VLDPRSRVEMVAVDGVERVRAGAPLALDAERIESEAEGARSRIGSLPR